MKRRRIYIIAVVILFLVFSTLMVMLSVRQSDHNAKNMGALAQEICNRYGDALACDYEYVGEDGTVEISFLLKEDVANLPQDLCDICDTYLMGLANPYPIAVLVSVDQKGVNGGVLRLSNVPFPNDSTNAAGVQDKMVSLTVKDTEYYAVGKEYHTLKNYEGIRGIKYLVIDHGAYYSSLVTEPADMQTEFASLESIRVYGRPFELSILPDRVDIRDTFQAAQRIDEPQQVTVVGAKANIVLSPGEYEITWQESESFSLNNLDYDYRISIYQDKALRNKIFPISDEDGDMGVVYTYQPEPERFTIRNLGGGKWSVESDEITRLMNRTDFEDEESTIRFGLSLKRMGVDAALIEKGAQQNDTVYINDFIFELTELI